MSKRNMTKGYRLYREHCADSQGEVVLDLTRAWTLVRFFNGGLLELARCCRCRGKFVAHKHDLHENRICALCRPPSGAGKRTSSRSTCEANTPT